MRLLSFLLLSCLLYLPATAIAQEGKEDGVSIKSPIGDFSSLKHTKSGRIDKIIDGLTLLLKDGTIIRLAALDIPDFNIWDHADHAEAALALLEDTLPKDTEIMMYQTRMAKKGRLNRMKHELAHIKTKKDDIWIQGLLIRHGIARVYTAPQAPEMLDQMLKAEQDARNNALGIWEEDSDYKMLSPETTEDRIGDFVVVEGKVKKTATVRNRIYLNFGDDWKTDFTIMMTPAIRKKLSKKRINPLALTHMDVRVRGWLRDYNGPLIELESAAHLEVLKETEAPAVNTPLPATVERPNLRLNP